jgi:MoxR-like ATPase
MSADPTNAWPTGEDSIATSIAKLIGEIRTVIVGQHRPIERMLVCLLAKGHCLLEGVPGLAKTLSVETLAATTGASFARIQFTPDLLPSDITGTRIFRASSEKFDVELGPIFVNFLLTDEINRAPAKVQSALLEVMAEQQVTIGGTTYPVPKPFLVMATQNPIESEGVYQLPDAQRDRFLMKVVLDYPSHAEELGIVSRMAVAPPQVRQIIDLDTVKRLQAATDAVLVDQSVQRYAVDLVHATRTPSAFGLAEWAPLVALGASPRASLGLVRAAKALAVIRNRNFATPQDVFDVAPEVLRHRVSLSYEALARDVNVEDVINAVLGMVPAAWVQPPPGHRRSNHSEVYGTVPITTHPVAGPATPGHVIHQVPHR